LEREGKRGKTLGDSAAEKIYRKGEGASKKKGKILLTGYSECHEALSVGDGERAQRISALKWWAFLLQERKRMGPRTRGKGGGFVIGLKRGGRA